MRRNIAGKFQDQHVGNRHLHLLNVINIVFLSAPEVLIEHHLEHAADYRAAFRSFKRMLSNAVRC